MNSIFRGAYAYVTREKTLHSKKPSSERTDGSDIASSLRDYFSIRLVIATRNCYVSLVRDTSSIFLRDDHGRDKIYRDNKFVTDREIVSISILRDIIFRNKMTKPDDMPRNILFRLLFLIAIFILYFLLFLFYYFVIYILSCFTSSVRLSRLEFPALSHHSTALASRCQS